MVDDCTKGKDSFNSIQTKVGVKVEHINHQQSHNNSCQSPDFKISQPSIGTRHHVKWNLESSGGDENKKTTYSFPPYHLNKKPLRRSPNFSKLDKLVSEETEVWIYSGEKRIWISTGVILHLKTLDLKKFQANPSDSMNGVRKQTKLRRSYGMVDLRHKAFSEADIPKLSDIKDIATGKDTASGSRKHSTEANEPSKIRKFFRRCFYRCNGNFQ